MGEKFDVRATEDAARAASRAETVPASPHFATPIDDAIDSNARAVDDSVE